MSPLISLLGAAAGTILTLLVIWRFNAPKPAGLTAADLLARLALEAAFMPVFAIAGEPVVANEGGLVLAIDEARENLAMLMRLGVNEVLWVVPVAGARITGLREMMVVTEQISRPRVKIVFSDEPQSVAFMVRLSNQGLRS